MQIFFNLLNFFLINGLEKQNNYGSFMLQTSAKFYHFLVNTLSAYFMK